MIIIIIIIIIVIIIIIIIIININIIIIIIITSTMFIIIVITLLSLLLFLPRRRLAAGLQISCFSSEGLFWVLPLTYFIFPTVPGRTFSQRPAPEAPTHVRIIYMIDHFATLSIC